MSSIIESLLVATSIFLGALGGLCLQRVLPRTHMTQQTLDVIKLGTGMLSVLASLVLGLLIATAKTSHDQTDQSIRSYTAELALLNEVLRDYGGQAAVPRDRLRAYTEHFLQTVWPADGKPSALGDDRQSSEMMEQVRSAIRALKPADPAQTALQQETTSINLNLLRQRWLLVEQQGPGVQAFVLGVLVFWVTVIFLSFGLNAPRNGTVVVALLVCALSIGASIFLILEMDQPLSGVMRISPWPVENALAQMQWKG